MPGREPQAGRLTAGEEAGEQPEQGAAHAEAPPVVGPRQVRLLHRGRRKVPDRQRRYEVECRQDAAQQQPIQAASPRLWPQQHPSDMNSAFPYRCNMLLEVSVQEQLSPVGGCCNMPLTPVLHASCGLMH